jgi:predicted nucleotidyltransferase
MDEHKKNARVTQKGGLVILDKFMKRVEEANRQPFAFSVGAIILFGSWDRNDKPHAGDIDIAIELIPKAEAGEPFGALIKSRLDAAYAAGRSLPSPQCFSWHYTEVYRFLQHGSRGLSLTPLADITMCLQPDERPFTYTVLRGDPESISGMFRASNSKLQICRIRVRDAQTGEFVVSYDDGTLKSRTLEGAAL